MLPAARISWMDQRPQPGGGPWPNVACNDLKFLRFGNLYSERATHLDLDEDQDLMHDLIVGQMREARDKVDDIGAWTMEVREHGKWQLAFTYLQRLKGQD